MKQVALLVDVPETMSDADVLGALDEAKENAAASYKAAWAKRIHDAAFPLRQAANEVYNWTEYESNIRTLTEAAVRERLEVATEAIKELRHIMQMTPMVEVKQAEAKPTTAPFRPETIKSNPYDTRIAPFADDLYQGRGSGEVFVVNRSTAINGGTFMVEIESLRTGEKNQVLLQNLQSEFRHIGRITWTAEEASNREIPF